ncbi:hypothetical protein ACPCHT_21655 [Nucisporomicrobium flavum]|uniref:hypothetical protein n=1 Tax=Nucisporomicrobium flavum TaxID=2785915 RepID=UPI003C2DFABC
MTASGTALLAATAVHLGFQATVTVLVYPALARAGADRWPEAHRAHTRAITPLVALIYGGLVVAGCWALLTGPGPWTWVALAATAAAALVTAFAAAPAHQRLGAGHDPRRIAGLLRADRARLAAALVAASAAVIATA